jgi:hypothetical protein
MKRNSSSRVTNFQITDINIGYPSLYEHSYDLNDFLFKIAIYELQFEWIGHFYALQWLDGSTVVVAVQK